MPLERSKEEYLGPGLDGIRCLMLDGANEVACKISLEAVAERGATTSLGEAGVFELYRSEIEQAASAKYDRGDATPDQAYFNLPPIRMAA